MVMDRSYKFNKEIRMVQIDKTGKRPKCLLINEWIKKMWDTCTMQYYSVIKRGNNAICSNMD